MTIGGYLLHLQAKGRAASTISRPRGDQAFYHFLVREQDYHTDPTINLDAPKQEKITPCPLGGECASLLKADLKHRPGLGDRTMLKFYTRLTRVTELVTKNFGCEFNRRLYPLYREGFEGKDVHGSVAIKYIRFYLITLANSWLLIRPRRRSSLITTAGVNAPGLRKIIKSMRKD